jgi:hypothetical protein
MIEEIENAQIDTFEILATVKPIRQKQPVATQCYCLAT